MMFFHRISLLIGLVLFSCSFVSAQYEIRNDVLYDNQDKQVPEDEYVKVMESICFSKEFNETIAEWLIHNGLQVNINDNLAIRCASEFGHSELVAKLLNNNLVDPAADSSYAIRYASNNGHSKVVKHLLNDKRVNPRADDNEAIRYASRNGHSEVVQLLLKDTRVDPTADNNEAVNRASKYGHAAVVELLLTNSKVDATKALKVAINNFDYGIVSIINKARPKLFINEEVLNLANKTIQVNTTISVENNKLNVNYESLKDYEATFVLTAMKDDSTIYLNVDNISNGKFSVEMSKLRNSNYWNWRWICAKRTIENNGNLDMGSITPDSNKSAIPDSNKSAIPDSNKSIIPDQNNSNTVSEESKLPIWLIVVIVISALAFVGIAAFVWFFIRSRRLGKNVLI